MLLTILCLELLPAPSAEGYAKQKSLDINSIHIYSYEYIHIIIFNGLCFVPTLRVGNNIDILPKDVECECFSVYEVLLISVKHSNKTNNAPIIFNNKINFKWQVGLQRLSMLRVEAEKKNAATISRSCGNI